MPLLKMDKVGITREGKNYMASRLVYRVGSSDRLAQVLDFEGRQFVDERLYKEKDEERMLFAAKEILFMRVVPSFAR